MWRLEAANQAHDVLVSGGWVQGFDIAGPADMPMLVVAADCAMHQAHTTAHATPMPHPGVLNTCPPGFSPKNKHALLQVVHAGPYAAAGDTFGYRWNAHLLASQGHVVAQVDYHGSSGFGFEFRDSIMGRMGQLEQQDIEAGTDWLLAQPWADRRRVFLAGGSYGGFMAAWLNGHLPAGRYQAHVCHAGVFDRVATFAADSYTQRPKDLGAQYWDDLPKVLSQSPCHFAQHMHTPILVSHGAQD